MQQAEWDFFKQKDFINDSTTLHKIYNSVTNIRLQLTLHKKQELHFTLSFKLILDLYMTPGLMKKISCNKKQREGEENSKKSSF